MMNFIAEQLLFSMLPWFLTFIVNLILGSFMAFWGPMGLFFWLGKGSKDVLEAAYIIHQLLFSRNGSIWALIYILNVLTHFSKSLKNISRQTDRQTGRQTDRHTDGETDRPTDQQTDRPTDRLTDIATYRAAIAAKNRG